MDFLAVKPSNTITVHPPGGTGHPHHGHGPLPSGTLPPVENVWIDAGKSGHTALWVVFVAFAVSFVAVIVMSLRTEKRSRTFHWISAAILGTAMLSYYAMANDQGVSYVSIEATGVKHPELYHFFRQVYWARYVDWVITTPMLLVSLCLLAGLSPIDSLMAIVLDVVMIVTGLFSGMTRVRWHSTAATKWGWFGISCAAFLGIWYYLIISGAKAAKHRPGKTRGLYFLLSGMTLLLWTAYPIVFGLSEGANKISLDAEIIAYAVLDVSAKIGFTFLLLIIHSHGDEDNVVLPDWVVTPRLGRNGADGRGNYGSISNSD